MRALIVVSTVLLTACGGDGLARGESEPACTSVGHAQRAASRIDKQYEELRQRTVASPTEKNQQKLAEAASEAAAANAARDATEAEWAAGRCPPR